MDHLSFANIPARLFARRAPKCGRAGQYRKQNLIERFGADMPLPDLREEIANCDRAGQMHDACMARFVDLITR